VKSKLEARVTYLTFKTIGAWLVGISISLAICFWPGGIILFAVAMWGGFSPDVSIFTKWLVLAGASGVIVFAAFLLARTIKRVLVGGGDR
jgi:hypothetical protein